jgi:uncharacterized membrane protein YhiD involved in acid resistance
MWMAGALGVASGAGHYVLAIVAALLSFAILRMLPSGHRDMDDGPDKRTASPPGPTLIVESSEDE